MSLQLLFDQLNIKDDRTRILAIVGSPQVFFERCETEDIAMMMTKPFVCHTFMRMIEMKNIHLQCLTDAYNSIQYALFHNSPKARDVLYAMRDPSYLDTLLKWANSVVYVTYCKHVEFTRDYSCWVENETGMPVFKLHKEYEEFNAKRTV